MELYLLKHENMMQTGKGLLRMIQNNTLPKIDLLVRECLQNSLDAGLPDKAETKVDIFTGKFRHAELDPVFEGISAQLKERFRDTEEMDFLAVRDSKTTGLTGPLRASEMESTNYGNLRKLIYEIGQKQKGEGEGGSWGIGKTVCFRLGIGIVMYYSRIATDDGGYASRMAATLIENEQDPDSLLRRAGKQKGNLNSGIAWWGKNDPASHNTMPITDEQEIEEILQIFHLEPYRGRDTGTTVIIPFIDREALAADANVTHDSNMAGLTLEDHLKLAVQRWYIPRYMNKDYRYGSMLRFSINGRAQRKVDWEPFFQKIQELYNAGYREGRDIRIRGMLQDSGVAGGVAYAELTPEELGISHGGLNPYQLIGKSRGGNAGDADGNPVIVCYCRNAGMIINYELGGASAWAADVPPAPQGKYPVAFFVLNGRNHLQADPSLTLDEYMRRGELADHTDWPDTDVNGHKMPLAERIKGNTSNYLKSVLTPHKVTSNKRNISGLQRALGKCLLPPDGFGKSAKRNHGEGSGSSSRSAAPHSRKASISSMQPVYDDYENCSLSFTITMPHERPRLVLSLAARTSSSQMTAAIWEDPHRGVGTPFPVSIADLQAEVQTEEGEAEVPCTVRKSNMGVPCSYELDTSALQRQKRKPIQLQCTIKIRSVDDFISSRLILEEVEA